MRPTLIAALLLLPLLAAPVAPVAGAADASAPAASAAPAAQPGGDGAPPAHVRLYQGYAAVRESVPVNLQDGRARVPLDLPAGAVFDTVRVTGDGVRVEEVFLPPNETQPEPRVAPNRPEPGDRVRVEVKNATPVTGTLLAMGDPVAIAAGNETVLIPRERVGIVRILEAPALPGEAGPDTQRAVAVVSSAGDAGGGGEGGGDGGGQGVVNVTYRLPGPTWRPVYDLVPETGELLMSAVVEGAPTFEAARLSLVVGQPHVEDVVRYEDDVVADEAAAAPGNATEEMEVSGREVTRAQVGELHVFTLERPVRLEEGRLARVPVASEDLTVEARHFDVDLRAEAAPVGGAPPPSQELPVRERVWLRNTLDFPLPRGEVNYVRDGLWAGSDTLPQLARNASTNVTLAAATSVDARLVTLSTSLTTEGERDRLRQAVEVTNRGDENVTARVTWHHPDRFFKALGDNPEPVGEHPDRRVWRLDLAPGASERVVLHYEVWVPQEG